MALGNSDCYCGGVGVHSGADGVDAARLELFCAVWRDRCGTSVGADSAGRDRSRGNHTGRDLVALDAVKRRGDGQPEVQCGQRGGEVGILWICEQYRMARWRRLHVRPCLREDRPRQAHRSASCARPRRQFAIARLRRHLDRYNPRSVYAIECGARRAGGLGREAQALRRLGTPLGAARGDLRIRDPLAASAATSCGQRSPRVA